MPVVRYTSRAESDLDEIADYTRHTWNKLQVNKYLDEMEHFCALLAQNPRLGRTYSKVHPAWWRMEHKSHVILYREIETGILVQRILHNSMLPQRQGF